VIQISTLLIQPISPCFRRKYAFEDFAIRQVALLLNKTTDETKYANRSLVRAFISAVLGLRTKVSPRYQSYRNVWDPDVTSDGFRGKLRLIFLERPFVALKLRLLQDNQLHSARRIHAETLPEWHFRTGGPRRLFTERPTTIARMLTAK
jgi:hypothetical protein